jgi:medium-chain acyl-[acyl-carrier-protein] hydrolase
MRLFLPPLRADFSLLDRYRYRDEPPLPVPLTLFYGTADPNDEVADLRAWAEHTSAGCAVVPLPFGHFFMRDAADDITDRVNAALRPAISA